MFTLMYGIVYTKCIWMQYGKGKKIKGGRILVMFERRAVDPHFLQFALNFFFDVLEPIFFVWTYSLYQLNV